MSGIPISGLRLLPGLEAPESIPKTPIPVEPLGVGEVAKPSFGSVLNSFVENVDQLGNAAEYAGSAFLNGDDIDLHEVMIAGEESGIAFDLLLEIRNKLIEAYKDMIRMPI